MSSYQSRAFLTETGDRRFPPLQSPNQVDSVTIQTQFISSPATSNRTSRRRHSADFRGPAVPMERADLLLLIMPPIQSPRRLSRLAVKGAAEWAARSPQLFKSHFVNSRPVHDSMAFHDGWLLEWRAGRRHHYTTLGHNMHNQRAACCII